MTPDTAALRALADDAPSGPPRTVRIAATIGNTATGVESAYLIGIDVGTVRALCDAADEVERLRAAVVERDTRLAETGLRGIETGLRESACAECDHDRCATYRSAASWVRDYAALDHHAPTTGATP